MKRMFYLLITVFFLLFVSGCKDESVEIIKPVQLYFCKADVSFQSADGLIASEEWEFSGWENKTLEFLNKYLAGPVSAELISPFPVNGRIVELTQNGSTVDILFNDNFTRLSPNELTTACACISLTVFDLLNAETINFEIASLDSENNLITMSRSTLLLSDGEEIS